MALQCHMTEAIRCHLLVTIALQTAQGGPIHRHVLLMELHPLEDHHGYRIDLQGHQWDHAHPDLVTLLSRCQDLRRDQERPHSSSRVQADHQHTWVDPHKLARPTNSHRQAQVRLCHTFYHFVHYLIFPLADFAV